MPNLSDFYLMVVAAQRHFSHGTFENQIYQLVERHPLFLGWSSERKADLYALLVESINHIDRISTVEDKVLAAYEKNAGRFGG
jgi:hypothetical protein